jgi:putative nucleotidyltransferase with HDIG domain/PAS domain S-box-containing protein
VKPRRTNVTRDFVDPVVLLAQIAELTQTLDAIRRGGVDAVVVGEPGAEQVHPLTSAERPYRAIVDNMSEGALTVSSRQIILFANRRFAEMIGRDPTDIVGAPISTLVDPQRWIGVDALLGVSPGENLRCDVALSTSHGPLPVSLSASCLDIDGVLVRCLVATDLTPQHEAERMLEQQVTDRTADLVAANADLANSNRTLQVITSSERALMHATDEATFMDAICRIIVGTGGYPLAWIGRAETDESRTIRPISAAGDTSYLDELNITWGTGTFGSGADAAIRTGQRQLVADVASSVNQPWLEPVHHHGFGSFASFPITFADQFRGVLSIYSNKADAFDPDAGHQRRVAELAAAICRQLGLDGDQQEGVVTAATIHDIGKLNIPAEILSKPGPLNAQEMALVKNHAQAGHDIVRGIDFPWPIAEMILQHHERLDGSGYPNGLTGQDTLLGSRIIAVADVVEAMSSHRPYRPALGLDAALDEIDAGRGIRYDPAVADACLVVCRQPNLGFNPGASEPFGTFA